MAACAKYATIHPWKAKPLTTLARARQQEIKMTNANMTREGRYTGPSLQAAATAYFTAATKISKAVKPKQTRAEISAAKDAAAIADLKAAGGIVAYGAWQTGTGNYKKARAVPNGAAVFPNGERTPDHVQAWFAAHPRAQRCVAIV